MSGVAPKKTGRQGNDEECPQAIRDAISASVDKSTTQRNGDTPTSKRMFEPSSEIR